MKKSLKKHVIQKIMDRAVQLSKQCNEECRDFRIMVSPVRKDTLILRWTTIDIQNIDNPVQCYHYECFYPNGISQNCSVNYTDQQQANAFFFSLETLYRQEFATDHRQDKTEGVDSSLSTLHNAQY